MTTDSAPVTPTLTEEARAPIAHAISTVWRWMRGLAALLALLLVLAFGLTIAALGLYGGARHVADQVTATEPAEAPR